MINALPFKDRNENINIPYSIKLLFARNNSKKLIFDLIIKSERNNEYPFFPYRFFFQEGNKWIAVDNSEKCCFIEEFNKLSEAINWLKREGEEDK